jgi:aspartyl-tRNA(Asn)/glutamyl-tRNA(Gln) amidotransferase subunit C
MSISRGEVERVARLAHLELSGEEIEMMIRDLNGILDYVECIERVNVEGIDPAGLETGGTPLREDRASAGLEPGEATGGAPMAERDLFKVPPAIEGE